MQEGEQKIREILKAMEINQASKELQHYVRNYAQGIIGKLAFIESPETSDQEVGEIKELYKRRAFFLRLLQRKIKNEGGEDLDAFFAQHYQEKKDYNSEVLEHYFLKNTATQ